MAIYARVQNNVVLGYETFDGPVDDQSKLQPGKPKLLPVVELNKTYDAVTQVQVQPPAVAIEATRVLWTYTNRPKTTAEVDDMREGKINAVHSEAQTRLLPKSGAAMSQQIMALTKLMQLIYKYTDRTAWSAADKNTVQQAIGRLQLVDVTRTTEDNKVTEVQALVDPAAINAYDTATGWPAA